MTITLLLLWALSGLATLVLIVTALVFTFRKKKSERYWISSGISAVLFIFLFFGVFFSIPSEDQSSEVASNNESGGEPIQTEIGKQAERERSLEEEREAEEENTEEETTEVEVEEVVENEPTEEDLEETTEEEFNPDDYQTGVDIAELERKPDDFTGQNFMYQGKIVQIMEDDIYTAYRVAINDDIDHIAYIQMFSSTLEQRYLEDDYITFYGFYEGLMTYETVMGDNRSLPAFTVNGNHIELSQ